MEKQTKNRRRRKKEKDICLYSERKIENTGKLQKVTEKLKEDQKHTA